MTDLYEGHGWKLWIEEAVLPDGRPSSMVRARRPDSVHILAFTDKQKILMLREYRAFYGQWIWMLPSGRVDKETDLLQTAQRELQEETGYISDDIRFWCTSSHTESVVMSNHFFIAKKLRQSRLPQDEDELIEVHDLSLDEAIEKVLHSPVIPTPSAFGLLRYAQNI
jgi:ADP-ribose pyrophosphatase